MKIHKQKVVAVAECQLNFNLLQRTHYASFFNYKKATRLSGFFGEQNWWKLINDVRAYLLQPDMCSSFKIVQSW